MESDILMLHEFLQSGKCCSQALAAMGLRLRGEESDALVRAAAGLCLGVRSGLICGALTGAAMMLCLFDPALTAGEMIPELTEWFRDTYGELYGGISCDEILERDIHNKAVRCPALVESTYRRAREILEDAGFDIDDMLEHLEEE